MTEDTLNDTEALAEVLGEIRVAGAREADWWTNDEDHHLLIRVLKAECVPWAEGLLASDWLRERTAALARDRDALTAKITRVEALAGEWAALAKDRERRGGSPLMGNVSGMVDRIRAALAGPEDTARDTQRDDEGSGSVKGCGYCGYGVGHTTDQCVRVSKPPARPVPADHGPEDTARDTQRDNEGSGR